MPSAVRAREERSYHPKAHWIRPHTGRTCREGACILCRASEPVLEFRSALRVCNRKSGCQRQTRTKVQDRGLRDASRETEDAARRGKETQVGDQHRSTGSEGCRDERHRIRPAVGGGKDQDVTRLQDRVALRAEDSIAGIAVKPRRCGNGGVEETAENQRRVSPCSLNPLEIRPTTPDSHIPTAPTAAVALSGRRQKQRKDIGRFATSPSRSFQDHSVLETLPCFRIIRGLENARLSAL